MKAVVLLSALACCLTFCQGQGQRPTGSLRFLERLVSGENRVFRQGTIEDEIEHFLRPDNINRVTGCLSGRVPLNDCDSRTRVVREIIRQIGLQRGCNECSARAMSAVRTFLQNIQRYPQQCIEIQNNLDIPPGLCPGRG